MNKICIAVIVIIVMFGGEKPLHFALKMFYKQTNKQCPIATDMKCPRPDVTFWLYTRSTKDNPTRLELGSLKSAPFVDAPLKILIHGYGAEKDVETNKKLRLAYFAHGEYNIISVDWKDLAVPPCYYAASHSVPTVSRCVVQFYKALKDARTFSSVHLLGYSLGGHIASWASHEIDGLTRLTGFELAYPIFGKGSPLLKKGVAKFVDIYYSNAGIYGQEDAGGDVNVYFNNGGFQPGCACEEICSHDRAIMYFTESVSGDQMKAFPCKGWSYYHNDKCAAPSSTDMVTVGENMDTKNIKHGRYMVFTNDKYPFLLDPALYLDKTSFAKFKKTAKGECSIYNAVKKINYWMNSVKRLVGNKEV